MIPMILRFIVKMDSKLLFILNTATFRSVVPGSTKIRHSDGLPKGTRIELICSFFIEQYRTEA